MKQLSSYSLNKDIIKLYPLLATHVELRKVATKLVECGKQIRRFMCTDCTLAYDVPVKCKLKVCPTCAKARSRELYKQYLSFFAGERTIRFLTLSFPNVKTLKSEHYKTLRKNFLKLRDVYRKRGKQFEKFISTIETKKTANGWNIHLHVAFLGSFLNRNEVMVLWRKYYHIPKKGYIHVDVRLVKGGVGALKYITKYVYKGSELNSEADLKEYYLATRNIRMFQTYGLEVTKNKKEFLCTLCQSKMELLSMQPLDQLPVFGAVPPDIVDFFHNCEVWKNVGMST